MRRASKSLCLLHGTLRAESAFFVEKLPCPFLFLGETLTCDNFMLTMREICFSDEGDWGLNEGDFLMTCSSCFSYHFHMV